MFSFTIESDCHHRVVLREGLTRAAKRSADISASVLRLCSVDFQVVVRCNQGGCGWVLGVAVCVWDILLKVGTGSGCGSPGLAAIRWHVPLLALEDKGALGSTSICWVKNAGPRQLQRASFAMSRR